MDPTSTQFPLMSMPNLRSLAAQGTTLTRHYASSPQCVPGRTTLFSGRRIDESGGYNNGMGWGLTSDGAAVDPQCAAYYNADACRRFGQNLQRFNATLFDVLSQIGYDVFLIGKVDVGAGIIESGDAHFDAQTNGTADGFHGGPSATSGLQIETRSANIKRATKGKPVADETDNNVHHEDFEIVAKCIDKLNALKEKETESESSKPWFLYCSINIPHPPYQTNATWLSGVDVSDIPLPQWLDEAQFHPADAYQSISKNVWGNFSDAAIQSVRATYYAMNVETDYLLGSVLNASFANGWDTANTLFVFTSDHGDMNMEHRQQLKNSMYEGSARIPLFFAGPNIEANKIISNVTATIDVLPTLIALGGGTVSTDFSGVSVFDPSHPPFVTSQYHSNMGNTGSFMVRKAQWKYIQFGHFLEAFADYAPQLFDVDADPEELKDVSGDAANAAVLSELEAILANEFNYEYVDCVAKFNDFVLFEEFQWLRYNESTLKTRLREAYSGFDDGDWQSIVDWRQQMLNVTNATCEQHAQQWLRPVREEERRQWFVDVKTLVKG